MESGESPASVVLRLVRIIAAVAGAGLAGLGLIAVATDGIGRVKIITLVLGAVLLAAAWLGPRTATVWRALALVLLNTVVAFLVLELAAGLILRFRDAASRDVEVEATAERRELAQEVSPYYADREWSVPFLAELGALEGWYHPHELWRRRPYRGDWHVIDDDGRRLTPGSVCEPGAVRVWTFGGSAMWGYGVPDTATIPAYLRRIWADRMARPLCLENFSQLGHNSTQGLIALAQRLQRCEVPDLVVFHDGVNDLNYAQVYGFPGAHRSLHEVALRLDTDVAPAVHGIQNLSLLRLARDLGVRQPPRPWRYPPRTPAEIPEGLADEVVDFYLNNLRMVSALAREYGFRSAFFWQPYVTMGRKTLTPSERAILRSAMLDQDGALEQDPWYLYYRRAYERIARTAEARPELTTLADAFDAVDGLIYLDSHHVTPDGNRLLAERMAAAIGDRLVPASDRPGAPACEAR